MRKRIYTAPTPRLVYSSPRDAGFRRSGEAPSFTYHDAQGRKVADEATLARIAKLAIPPAYRDVWICGDPLGHLQAVGRDARGRLQYRYHRQWRELRDREKFDRMGAFGAALPKLRRRVRRDLASPGLSKRKVVALAVRILDATMIRVGNEAYTRENRSYGLTTLRNRHVRFVSANRVVLSFRGKSGIEQEVTIKDREIVRHVRRCRQLPGQLLFQYLDDAGERHAVTSDMVNDYVQECCGEGFSAKDFRTWGATMLALRLLAGRPLPDAPSERQFAQAIKEVIAEVARTLGNTVAICRKSYINPAVFDAWRRGDVHAAVDGAGDRAKGRAAALRSLVACEAPELAATLAASLRAGAAKRSRASETRPPAPA